MNKIVLIIIILSIKQPILFGQNNIDKELMRNVYKINSLDYNVVDVDLVFLDKALAGKEIVVLGEHYHGDANTIQLKSRIIKYLTEKHNYKTIFYELPYEDVNRINYLAQDSLEYLVFLSTLLPVTDATWDLYTNISKHRKGISFEGIDISMQRTCMGSEYYYDSIFVRTSNKTLIDNWKVFGRIYSYSINFNKLSKEVFEYLKEKKEIVLNEINKNSQFNDSLKIRYGLVIENMYREIVRFNNTNPLRESIKRSIRDSTMFFNFKTLYENYYKGQKIIIIVSNYHASRNITSLHKGFKDLTLGDYLYNYLGDKIYTIAGTSYSGFTGSQYVESTIPKPKKRSYEELIHRKKYKYAFIDLSKNIYKNNLYLNAVGYNSLKLSNWNKIFDGVIYTEISKIEKEKYNLNVETNISLDSLYFLENIYQMGYINAVRKRKCYECEDKLAFDDVNLSVYIRKGVVRFSKMK